MFSPARVDNNEHDVATNQVFHFSCDGALRDGRPLPCVRYSAQSAKNSALYDHPNNVLHREVAKKKKAVLDADDTASDTEDEHEQEANNNGNQSAGGGAGGDTAGVAAGDAAADGGAGGDAADGGG